MSGTLRSSRMAHSAAWGRGRGPKGRTWEGCGCTSVAVVGAFRLTSPRGCATVVPRPGANPLGRAFPAYMCALMALWKHVLGLLTRAVFVCVCFPRDVCVCTQCKRICVCTRVRVSLRLCVLCRTVFPYVSLAVPSLSYMYVNVLLCARVNVCSPLWVCLVYQYLWIPAYTSKYLIY